MGEAAPGEGTRQGLGVAGKVAIAAGIVALAGVLVLVILTSRPAGTAVQRHDDRLRRLEAAVCESDPDLQATTVTDCAGTIDASPDASGCRYTLELTLQTEASEDELVRYFTAFPAPEDFGDHLFRPEESTAVETDPSGGASVRILMIGDALEDPPLHVAHLLRRPLRGRSCSSAPRLLRDLLVPSQSPASTPVDRRSWSSR